MKFDEIAIEKLPVVLTENTMPARYYPLVPESEDICNRLTEAGIVNSSEFLAKFENDFEGLLKTGIDEGNLVLLAKLLRFNRFRPVKINKFDGFRQVDIDSLSKSGIKDTGELSMKCRTDEDRRRISLKSGIEIDELKRMCCFADLMRLPGVKNIRAELYFKSGFKTLKSMAASEPDEIIESTTEYIDKKNLEKSPPLPKEVATQIAWAKVLPVIFDL